jgi:peptide/nickel transport system ATP-binding protein
LTNETVISVINLKVYFYTNQRCNKAVNGVSFEIKTGKTLCIVGESGCGKSVTASALMGLLPRLSRIEEGEIHYSSDKLGHLRIDQLEKNGATMRSIRGSEIAMIFQDPMTALNPVLPVGYQIAENLIQHTELSKKEAANKAVDLIRDMGIPLPNLRVNEYPHQFSGGMRQRAIIAMAMACNPRVLIADEPTTALDVTVQAQIFDLMDKLKEEHNTAILLITHDMGVVTELADDVAVMYMGNVVEKGTVDDVLRTPAHPYTKALLESIPILGRGKNQQIEPIKGATPDPYKRPKGCQFSPRCSFMDEICEVMPDESELNRSHSVRCWHPLEVPNHG